MWTFYLNAPNDNGVDEIADGVIAFSRLRSERGSRLPHWTPSSDAVVVWSGHFLDGKREGRTMKTMTMRAGGARAARLASFLLCLRLRNGLRKEGEGADWCLWAEATPIFGFELPPLRDSESSSLSFVRVSLFLSSHFVIV